MASTNSNLRRPLPVRRPDEPIFDADGPAAAAAIPASTMPGPLAGRDGRRYRVRARAAAGTREVCVAFLCTAKRKGRIGAAPTAFWRGLWRVHHNRGFSPCRIVAAAMRKGMAAGASPPRLPNHEASADSSRPAGLIGAAAPGIRARAPYPSRGSPTRFMQIVRREVPAVLMQVASSGHRASGRDACRPRPAWRRPCADCTASRPRRRFPMWYGRRVSAE